MAKKLQFGIVIIFFIALFITSSVGMVLAASGIVRTTELFEDISLGGFTNNLFNRTETEYNYNFSITNDQKNYEDNSAPEKSISTSSVVNTSTEIVEDHGNSGIRQNIKVYQLTNIPRNYSIDMPAQSSSINYVDRQLKNLETANSVKFQIPVINWEHEPDNLKRDNDMVKSSIENSNTAFENLRYGDVLLVKVDNHTQYYVYHDQCHLVLESLEGGYCFNLL